MYGGRVDNTFDMRVLTSYLLQYFSDSVVAGKVYTDRNKLLLYAGEYRTGWAVQPLTLHVQCTDCVLPTSPPPPPGGVSSEGWYQGSPVRLPACLPPAPGLPLPHLLSPRHRQPRPLWPACQHRAVQTEDCQQQGEKICLLHCLSLCVYLTVGCVLS